MTPQESQEQLQRFTLSRQLADERDNAECSRQALGDLWDLGPQVVELLHDLAKVCPYTESGHVGFARALLFAYRSAVMALVHAVRLQFVEASIHERRTLEWIALAWHFWEVPVDFGLWQEVFGKSFDPRDHPRGREYWARFNPSKIQEYLAAISPELTEAYQQCNLMMHGTIVSQVRAMSVSECVDPDMAMLSVSFIDLDDPDAMPLAAEVFGLLNSTAIAVEHIATVALGPAQLAVWNESLAPLQARIRAEALKWKERRV